MNSQSFRYSPAKVFDADRPVRSPLPARPSGRHVRLWEAGPDTMAVNQPRTHVEALLEHRAPFLFVEKITHVDPVQRAARALRRIHPEDPVLAGHFPTQPIYPGVLQLETMGQLGACLLYYDTYGDYFSTPKHPPLRAFVHKIHEAVFVAPLRPGDEVEILSILLENTGYTAVAAGQLLCAGKIVAFSVAEVYLVDP